MLAARGQPASCCCRSDNEGDCYHGEAHEIDTAQAAHLALCWQQLEPSLMSACTRVFEALIVRAEGKLN